MFDRCIPLVALLFASVAAAAPPNIVVLFADDQRVDSIGCYGSAVASTPNIDALGERGTRFERAYCMGSMHGAVCIPSRAMLLSGRSLYHVPQDMGDVPLLPVILRENGYRTFVTGKWHNGRDSILRAFNEGSAVFMGGMCDHTRVKLADIEGGALVRQRMGEGYSTSLFVDAAIDFIEQHDDERPYFVYVAFTAPHDPRQPPPGFPARTGDARPPLPANYMPQHPFHNGWMTGRDEQLAAWPREPEVVREQLAEYIAMVEHLDHEVGRVVEAIEQAGETDNTIVIYAADHGLAVGSHGLLGKQSVYEHSMRTPLIIADGAAPSGRVSTDLCYLFDIAPTLLHRSGVPAPEGLDGRDLLAGDPSRETVYLCYEDSMRAVVGERYKLIRYPRIDHMQLFDLVDDPHELNSLVTDPAHAERVRDLLAVMHDWHAEVDDPHPLNVAEPEPMEIDLTGRERKPDRWQPAWIIEKYFGDND